MMINGLATTAFLVSVAVACPQGALSAGKGPHARVLRIEGGDDMTAKQLAELDRRSVTGRDLLQRIERLRATVLIIRAYPLLAKTTGLYGRGRFWVAGGQLFGYLQYQTESMGNDRPLCIIVHELAHAVEVAGIDRREGTAAIREFVLSRALGDDALDWRGSETEFPRTITHHVWLELLGRMHGPSVLDSLALAHGISLPTAQIARAPDPRRPGESSRSAPDRRPLPLRAGERNNFPPGETTAPTAPDLVTKAAHAY